MVNGSCILLHGVKCGEYVYSGYWHIFSNLLRLRTSAACSGMTEVVCYTEPGSQRAQRWSCTLSHNIQICINGQECRGHIILNFLGPHKDAAPVRMHGSGGLQRARQSKGSNIIMHTFAQHINLHR